MHTRFSFPARTARFRITLLLTLVFSQARADTLFIPSGDFLFRLQPYAEILETENPFITLKALQETPSLFVPAAEFKARKRTNYFWLKIPLKYAGEAPARVGIRFSQLTFVTYYLTWNNEVIDSGRAGKFRSQSEIKPGNTRFRFTISVVPGTGTELWLKVHHTKKYMPHFDFSAEPESAMLLRESRKTALDFMLMGAVAVLLLYTIFSLIVTKFRPYLWLLVFITGMAFYGVSMAGYFIGWFFPENPETGWLFNIHFAHVGLAGMLLLLLDFWKLRLKTPLLHGIGGSLVIGTILVSLLSFVINYFWSDYHLMNTINIILFIFPFIFIGVSIAAVWKKLDRAQRLLGYGVVVFALGGFFIAVLSATIQESSIAVLPYVSSSIIIVVTLFFSTGLKEELRLLEKEKTDALRKLSVLHLEQNILLEEKVKERTLQIEKNNRKLSAQKQMLAEKNEKIMLLMNELGHRVKNNLQMLYSLESLQLPQVKDQESQNFLKGNIARIRAMMVVNKELFHFKDTGKNNAGQLARELGTHISGIYHLSDPVDIVTTAPPDLDLNGNQALTVSLILTELLTNSLKHAFENHPSPGIRIAFERADEIDNIILSYRDNGPKTVLPSNTGSIGLSLIKDLALQLNATMVSDCSEGWYYRFEFPETSLSINEDFLS